MIAIGYRMLGNLEEARDLAQEAFIRLWQIRARPDEASNTFALLLSLLRRASRIKPKEITAKARSSQRLTKANPIV